MNRGGAAIALALAVAALLVLQVPSRCIAGTEEFSTFGVESQEEDDESLLDHFMCRSPRAWRDEWEHAPQAIRTSQGCLTSGQWILDTDLKVTAPLGSRARFGLDVIQAESDVESYDYFDFTFRFPTRFGTIGGLFRPFHDKSRQDFAALWGFGADTTRYQLQLMFTLEDTFNNLWAFRQTRVGNQSEPYEKRPYEPSLRFVTREERMRFEVAGRYLSPSTKHELPIEGGSVPRRVTLWGARGNASVEVQALGFTWEAAGGNRQALGTDQPIDISTGDHHDFRRTWYAEAVMRRTVHPRVGAEAHYLYQSRTEDYGPPVGPASFGAIDRLLSLQTDVRIDDTWTAQLGGLYDRITVGKTGVTPWYSPGTRNESRAYVGLTARFAHVRLAGVEGIEMDPEKYDVWLWHDKGFLQLQATF